MKRTKAETGPRIGSLAAAEKKLQKKVEKGKKDTNRGTPTR